MNRRTKILAGGLAGIVALLALRGPVYARWIEPLVTIDKRLEEKRNALADLQGLEDRVKRASKSYRDLVARAGSFDIDRVAVSARDRLNDLIEKHHLQAESVSPSRPIDDRKTGAKSITINIKAVGGLESVVAFLKDVYELPFLFRVGNVAMYPASSSSRDPREEVLMNLRLPIELKVPPQHRIVGRIEDADLAQPPTTVRHQGRDYSLVWSGRPFNVYVPPQPLAAEAGKDQNIKVGQEITLRGMATGGDGPYTYQWSGPGLRDAGSQNCGVDTSSLPSGEHVFTLLIVDGKGRQSSDTVKLTVKETVATRPNKPADTPPPPPPPPDPRWKDRQQKQVVMVLGTSGAGSANDELMVSDRRSGETSYYKVGDEFDGGTLLHVHQTGGLVRRKDGVFVYPIGAGLDQDIPIEAAVDHVELQQAAQRLAPLEETKDAPAGASVDPGGSARVAVGEAAAGSDVGRGTVLEPFDPSDGMMGPGIPPLDPTTPSAQAADAVPATLGTGEQRVRTPPKRTNRPSRGPKGSK